MAMNLSKGELVKLAKRAESIQTRAKTALKKADDVVEKAVNTTVIGVTAFGMGMVQGRYGSVEIVGIPVDLAVGIGAHVLGFMGVGGRASTYLHSVGDGSLATFAASLGRGTGMEMAKKALGTTTKGESLSDAEMRKLASGV